MRCVRAILALAAVGCLVACQQGGYAPAPSYAGTAGHAPGASGPQVGGYTESPPSGAYGAALPPPTVRPGPAVPPSTPGYERPIADAPYVVPPVEGRPVPPPGTWSTTPGYPTREEAAVLDQVNQIRWTRGLKPLRPNGVLHRAAAEHSQEQQLHGYMGHGSPDPNRRTLAQRMGLAGYAGLVYAEVVAWGYRDTRSVVEGWMNSRDHREILLDPELTEGAFARVGDYWTGNFGTPRWSVSEGSFPAEPGPYYRAPQPRAPEPRSSSEGRAPVAPAPAYTAPRHVPPPAVRSPEPRPSASAPVAPPPTYAAPCPPPAAPPPSCTVPPPSNPCAPPAPAGRARPPVGGG